jgi:2-iminobutanoate/2-iminopropanoate deaminase
MRKTPVHTDEAPRAIGPYSQAIRSGDFIFCSGQIGLTPEGTLVEGDVADQTRQALANLQAVLIAAGSNLHRVVKTTVFLTTMEHFAAMNAAYTEAFPRQPPARSTVAVAALPRQALVEIECVAIADPLRRGPGRPYEPA